MKNYVVRNYSFAITIVLATIILPIRELESLFCHRCLAMECDSKGKADVCESVRNFVTKELRSFYYIGNYLEECPEPDNMVEWRQREFSSVPCEASRSQEATCALGRIRVTSYPTEFETEKEVAVTHATILGCATIDLLKILKESAKTNKCNSETGNSTGSAYRHFLEIEHCPQLSDYCHTVDYCIHPSMSIVRPYQTQTKDSSFEYGTIVGIVIGIIIIFLVVIAASVCRSPLNRATNYSPSEAQASSNVPSPSRSSTTTLT